MVGEPQDGNKQPHPSRAALANVYASTPRGVTGRLARRLVDVLLPAPCLACGKPVSEPRTSLGLCQLCRGHLAPCPPFAGGNGGPLARVLSAWLYQPPLDAVVAALKFERLDYLGAQLGRAVAAALGSELTDCEVVVPIPLHWWRFLRRGYNQAALIARPVAAALDLPLRRSLRRRRATPPQSRLHRAARSRNLAGAFSAAASCRGRHVLLVDDVITTGATLSAAAACLQARGARAVTGLTVALTPPPDDKNGAFLPHLIGRNDTPMVSL